MLIPAFSIGSYAGYLATFLIFVMGCITDYLDGYVARRYQQESRFGAMADPITDKMLTLSAVFCLVYENLLPVWMFVALLVRDLFLTGIRFFLLPPGKVAARFSGKSKTLLQMIIIASIFFVKAVLASEWEFAINVAIVNEYIYYGMFIVVGLSLWSGMRFIQKNVHAISA